MRAIDADAFADRMYREAFEKDSDDQKWDSGCWIRYKMFERVLREAPTIEPERNKGMWIEHNPHKWGLGIVFECSECGEKIDCEPSNFCPNCGADMRTPVETARDIVHEAIDNSVWSDTVDVAVMHKIVDEYNEMRGEANADVKS